MAFPMRSPYARRMAIPRRARHPLILSALLLAAPSSATSVSAPPDMQQWQAQAKRVTITRDDWGIPHIKGRSDADAVFGIIYAQAEDDFPRIEANYLTALGLRLPSLHVGGRRNGGGGGGGGQQQGRQDQRVTRVPRDCHVPSVRRPHGKCHA